MSVYIKGMNAPKHCAMCMFHGVIPDPMVSQHWCKLTGENMHNPYKKHDGCPIVAVPAHGRLIDAIQLQADMMEMVQSGMYGMEDMIDAVIEAPTIIPR